MAWHAIQQIGQRSMQGPLSVRLAVSVAVPASWPMAKRERAMAGKLRPAVKPDVDNITKAILDALNGVLWRDDAQVVELHVSKRYAAEAQVVVEVMPI